MLGHDVVGDVVDSHDQRDQIWRNLAKVAIFGEKNSGFNMVFG